MPDPMLWRADLVPQYHAYRDEILAAVERVLDTGRYILAREGTAFEEEFAAYLGAEHVVGVANGTDALVLALQILGVGPGDEVVTTAFTAFPTIGAIFSVGATPVFVDICPDSLLIDIERVPAAITPKTRAIMPVHLFGNLVDVERLREIVGPGIPILEDAAQAHGSTLRGRMAGTFGDLAGFSFYPTKNLGGYGDGGAIVVKDAEQAARLRLLRNHGMPDKDHAEIAGVNSRLDELQAAILRVKLRYLDAMNARRNEIAARYVRELPADRFMHQKIAPDVVGNYHVFESRFVGGRGSREERDRLVAALDERRIQTNVYYPIPHHLQAATRHLGYRPGSLPETEAAAQQAIALPMYPELEDAQVSRVIEAIRACVGADVARPARR